MPQLTGFPRAKQFSENSCWACAGRMISNWFRSIKTGGDNAHYANDADFAKAWADKKSKPAYEDINIQRSASAALADLGYKNNTDDHVLPSLVEISGEIMGGRPMLAMVGMSLPKSNDAPDLKYTEGHWVVIVGVDVAAKTIDVFDPDTGKIETVAHGPKYKSSPDLYWEHTSWLTPDKASV